MRKLVLTAVAAAATLVAAPAADAHPNYHYVGGCSMAVVSADMSNTPTWTVAVGIAAVATDAAGLPAAAPIGVDCWLRVDAVDHGYVASASSLRLVVADVPETLTIVAPFGATFLLCSDVLVAGEQHRDCAVVPLTHADGTVCLFIPGDDVYVGDKLVYDCPAYTGG